MGGGQHGMREWEGVILPKHKGHFNFKERVQTKKHNLIKELNCIEISTDQQPRSLGVDRRRRRLAASPPKTPRVL